MKITKKLFREWMNDTYEFDDRTWGNGNYRATKRKYGDYLYSQDPELFRINMEETVADPHSDFMQWVTKTPEKENV